MSRKVLLFITFFLIPMSAFMGVPSVYGIGHYGVPGTTAACDVCHDFANGYYDCSDCHAFTEGVQPEPPEPHLPGPINLRWVKTSIQWPEGGPTYTPVKFTTFDGSDGSLADGNDSKLDGPCEVCHPPYDPGPPETGTWHHNNVGDGTGHTHYDGTNCTGCHPHFVDDIVNYFEPRFIGTQAHTTHFTDPKGPRLGTESCPVCHLSNSVFSTFADGNPFETTQVCNNCHSEGGVYNGVGDMDGGNPDSVAYGAKYNWEDGIYTEDGDLKTGKEDWCTGCHDDQPATTRIDGTGISAPNVMGDSGQTYGFKVSGHGRNPFGPVYCHDCHDTSYDAAKDALCQQYGDIPWLHIDEEPRSYFARNLTYNYMCGYRLNTNLIVPRVGQIGQTAFQLCYKGCHHIYIEQFSSGSNFRDDYLPNAYYHERHLDDLFSRVSCWDSDWDGTIDSAMSCTACHNIHGSPMDVDGSLESNPVMIRHGELISTPTVDKVPAFDFHWYKYNGTPVGLLDTSRIGGLLSAPGVDVSAINHVCYGACHTHEGEPPGPTEITYTRNPGDVTIILLRTLDQNDNVKTTFSPGEEIHYHVRFKVFGPSSSFLKTFNSRAYSTSGFSWETPLKRNAILVGGATYDWQWTNTTIPPSATGTTAAVKITIKNFEYQGGPLIGSHTAIKTFTITP